MSAIAAVVDFDGGSMSRDSVTQMIDAMSARGVDRKAVWSDDYACLAVSRYEWESHPDICGDDLIAVDDRYAAVADGSLYYRSHLAQRLENAGVLPLRITPSRLILAACRAWGDRCADLLDGDFAFIVWDRQDRRILFARDHGGSRPLHYSERGNHVLIASTIGGVTAHARCPETLDLANLAVDAANLIFASGEGTPFAAVSALPPGSTGSGFANCRLRVRRWWKAEPANRLETSVDDLATRLRSMLAEAVRERVTSDGKTAMWLSGGWDSSAVFAAGNIKAVNENRLEPVSVRYPPDDSGYEDDFIAATARHWSAPVSWLDARDMPLIQFADHQARQRDEPYSFLFDGSMRFLARGTRATGSRIALSGNGGNFLFECSPVFLADLLATGRLPTLVREWRAMGVPSHRGKHFIQWAVLPVLPNGFMPALELLRGRRIHGVYERPLPRWIRADFARRHDLADRARKACPPRGKSRLCQQELQWFLTHPAFGRLNSLCHAAALVEGVELRAPIYDRRIVEFAAAGPWHERFSNGRGKQLLRRSMRGYLPASVLADRQARTGTLTSYVSRSLHASYASMHELFADPILADLGIVEPSHLLKDLDRIPTGRLSGHLPSQLLSAANVECWIRSRIARQPVRLARCQPRDACLSRE